MRQDKAIAALGVRAAGFAPRVGFGPWIAAVALMSGCLVLVGPSLAQQGVLILELAQAGPGEALRINMAPTIPARPASQVPLAIRIIPPNALPKNCFVRLRGLPPSVSPSEGHATGPGAWAVPLYALASLHLNVPAGVGGRFDLSVSLVGEDGTLLADTQAALIVEAPAQAASSEPKAQVPPARPPAPVLSPADREAAERLVARGEREIEQGQVAVARNFFLRAAQAGLAKGALLLAATYDPRELQRWRVQGVQPNLEEARKWYGRARELGAPEAEERLARLGAG